MSSFPCHVAKAWTKDYIIYDVWIAFEVVFVYFFFKETQGMSLEETAAIFDGQEYVEDITRKGDLGVATIPGDGERVADIEEKAMESQGRVVPAVLERGYGQ